MCLGQKFHVPDALSKFPLSASGQFDVSSDFGFVVLGLVAEAVELGRAVWSRSDAREYFPGRNLEGPTLFPSSRDQFGAGSTSLRRSVDHVGKVWTSCF